MRFVSLPVCLKRSYKPLSTNWIYDHNILLLYNLNVSASVLEQTIFRVLLLIAFLESGALQPKYELMWILLAAGYFIKMFVTRKIKSFKIYLTWRSNTNWDFPNCPELRQSHHWSHLLDRNRSCQHSSYK